MMSVDELRSFVLTLDGASEASHQGNPDFRYGNRIVVNLEENTNSITIKLPLDEQAALIARGDGAFSRRRVGKTRVDNSLTGPSRRRGDP